MGFSHMPATLCKYDSIVCINPGVGSGGVELVINSLRD